MADKSTLSIVLTEPVVFLRGADASGRRRARLDGTTEAVPSALLRGLVTLHVAKPTRFSKIDVELEGKSSITWPEGIGARRIDVSEDHTVFSAKATFFDAATLPETSRRPMSTGPGVHFYAHDESRGRRGRDSHPPPARRQQSTDVTTLQHDALSYFEHMPPTPHALPTPPYTPSASVRDFAHPAIASPGGGTPSADEDPYLVLAHSRNALLAGLEHAHIEPPPSVRRRSMTPAPLASSASSFRSGAEPRGSSDEDHDSGLLSPSRAPSRAPSLAPLSRVPSATPPGPAAKSPASPEHDARGRKKAFSLGGMFSAVRSHSRREPSLDHVTEDGAAGAPRTGPGPSRERAVGSPSASRSRPRGANAAPQIDSARAFAERGRRREKAATPEIRSPGASPERDASQSMSVVRGRSALGRVFGLDGHGHEHDHKEVGLGWKEFKKGTYTYPIAFSIPTDCPASMQAPNGFVKWQIRATAHRPGAFTSAMRAEAPVSVVAAPGEEDTEDTEAIVVERTWDAQLQYLISVAGRAFTVGGTIPMQMTLMPLEKVKLHRLSVFLDEKVEYMTGMQRVVRTDPLKRHLLLSVKHEDDGPLLPIISDDPRAFFASPLFPALEHSLDAAAFDSVPTGDPLPDEIAHDARVALDRLASDFMGPGPWTLDLTLPLPANCAQLRPSNKNRRANVLVSHTLRVVFRVERSDPPATPPPKGKEGEKHGKLFDIVVQTPVHILSCLCQPEMTMLPRYSDLTSQAPRPLPSGQLCACPTGRSRSRGSPGPLAAGGPASATRGTHWARSVTNEPGSRELFAQSARFERLVAGMETESGEAPPAYDELD